MFQFRVAELLLPSWLFHSLFFRWHFIENQKDSLYSLASGVLSPMESEHARLQFVIECTPYRNPKAGSIMTHRLAKDWKVRARRFAASNQMR